MRSNVKKQSRKLPNTIITNEEQEKGFSKTPTSIQLMQAVKQVVQSDFEKFLQEEGEDKATEILKKMLSTEYIKTFTPSTREMQKTVKNCVNKLAEKVVITRVSYMSAPENLTKKSLSQLEKELALIEEIKEYISRNEVRLEISNIIKEYNVQILERKNSEINYYEKIKTITKNFRYLVQDPMFYFSANGGENACKFENFEEYTRFNNLRNVVQARMSNLQCDEETAINAVLKDVSNKNRFLKLADKKILEERSKVIQKQHEKEER